MKSVLNKIINLGVHENMDEFRASRIRTLNIVNLTVASAYLAVYPIYLYLHLFNASYYILVLTSLLLLPPYLNHKRKYIWAKFTLTSNTWVLLSPLGLYLGEGAGHAYAFIASAILWFIIYNRVKVLIIIETINLCVALFTFYTYYNFDPIWQGEQEALFPLKVLIVSVSIIVAMLTIAIFKINNYKLLSLIKGQKIEIGQKKGEHDSSIAYALGIQKGLLPNKNKLAKFSIQNFIYYQPKDVVSGDFYWAHEDEKRAFIALGDCTGHGIPGAMVSIIGLFSFDNAVEHYPINSPAELLKGVNKGFMAKMSNSDLRDGMDVSVVMYDKIEKKWSFSSANNSALLCKNGSLEIIKGDKVPIGHHPVKIDKFTNIPFDLNPGDLIYMYSDGYRDQFGGRKGKKLGVKKFKEILLNSAGHSFEKQVEIFHNQFENWKGSFEQIDDVSLVGIQIHKKID